ncbi:MAG: TIGR02530 family flagellar biosynthesis protein [Bacillota bacterium]
MKNINNEYIVNRSKVKGIDNKSQKKNKNINSKKSFEDVLKKINQNKKIKFSNHAKQRLTQRNINLTKEDVNKISNAVSKAKNKGVKDVLILMNDNAFITSVKNNTVITATNGKDLKENVFTNIDGAVII